MGKNKDKIELEGIVTLALKSNEYEVTLDNGHTITTHVSGKMRMANIRILVGDRVKVQVTPYDLTRGIIIWRILNKE